MDSNDECIAQVVAEMMAVARQRFGQDVSTELAEFIQIAARSIVQMRCARLDETMEPDFLHTWPVT